MIKTAPYLANPSPAPRAVGQSATINHPMPQTTMRKAREGADATVALGPSGRIEDGAWR